ncbi:MAG: ferrous iron transporter B, partial [Sphingobacteriaceae bacterium]
MSGLKVALVGNPNTGKSTLFNVLTGLNQKVGNFPGVTVDKKTGFCVLADGRRAEIIDLPGTYSLYPKSKDESIVFSVLADRSNPHNPDLVVVILDASNLKRNLLLYTQVADLKVPVIVALNMMDMAKTSGLEININLLSKKLGVPVVPISARKAEGIDALKEAIGYATPLALQEDTIDIAQLAPQLIHSIREEILVDNDYYALQLAHQHEYLQFLSPQQNNRIESLEEEFSFHSQKSQATETIARYNFINDVLFDVVKRQQHFAEEESYSNKIDKFLTHKIFGFVIFFAILMFIFQAIFSWSAYPMTLIEDSFTWLSTTLHTILPAGPLTSLLLDGVVAGLSGVLVFIPQMSTRTIENWKDRMITIMVTPLITCSARLPVYTLLISLVVPNRNIWWIFNLQGIAMMAMYLFSVVSAVVVAWVFKLILKSRERGYFIMELPVYRMPRWKNVGLTMYERSKTFVIQAGKVIIAVSIILWVLASYGPPKRMQAIEQKYNNASFTAQKSADELQHLKATDQLENSYAGILGHAIEPAIRPLGFDWKIGIALITSFAAREVFVGTMATIYSVDGNADKLDSVLDKMKHARNSNTGLPVFT